MMIVYNDCYNNICTLLYNLMHLLWHNIYLYASAMYMQNIMKMSNIYLCAHLSSNGWTYIENMSNILHTTSNSVDCLRSCMVDCCIWLFFCIFCTYIIPAFFVERSLLLGYNSFDIALTYPYDTTLVITHCCLISKEIYNTILCILLYNYSYTHIQYNVNDTNPHQTQLNFQRNSFQ